ncbi:MAG: iron ABC transporter permease [Actinobacteria bacterium]|nr:iron ABC transporter permease [Actinomycetota bacterium]
MTAGGRRSPTTLALWAALVAVAALAPLAYLFVRAADAGLGDALRVATDETALHLLWNSVVLAVAVTITCVAIAVPLAWLTTRPDLPGRTMWTVLTALPLVVPSYIAAYALIGATGPSGLLSDWLEPLGIGTVPRPDGLAGAWAVLSAVSYPYVLLPVRAALLGLDPSLEEASRALGRSPRETFLRVVLPHLRPAVGAGGLLVALYALSDFGAVSLTRYDTFTRSIFLEYRSSFDRTPAAVLALVLVVLCVLVLAAETRTRGRGAYHSGRATGTRARPVAALGRARWGGAAACAVAVGAALVLPVLVVVTWATRGGGGADVAWEAALHSVQASLVAAVVTVAAAWPVSYLAARFPGRLARLVEGGSFVGHVLPGVVVALSLVFLGTRLVPSLYQTQALLTFAYVVLFLPLAVGALRTSLLQVAPSLEDASRSLGERWWGTWRRVTLPLVRPGAAAGFALVFLTAMKELPATLLLAPTGFNTLATEIWGASAEAFFARAAGPARGLIGLAAVPLALIVARDAGGKRARPRQPPATAGMIDTV